MRLIIEMPPAAKERPRFTGRRAVMPAKYVAWKEQFGGLAIHQAQGEAIAGKFRIAVIFHSPKGEIRPDLDNAIGAVLDALQDAGIIENDRHCKTLAADVAVSPTPSIEVILTPV